MHLRPILLVLFLAFGAPLLVAATPRSAADATDALVLPLFEEEPLEDEVAPLRAWIDERVQAGAGRKVAGDLRKMVQRVSRQRVEQIERGIELLYTHREHRRTIVHDLEESLLSYAAARREHAKLPAAPSGQQLFLIGLEGSALTRAPEAAARADDHATPAPIEATATRATGQPRDQAGDERELRQQLIDQITEELTQIDERLAIGRELLRVSDKRLKLALHRAAKLTRPVTAAAR